MRPARLQPAPRRQPADLRCPLTCPLPQINPKHLSTWERYFMKYGKNYSAAKAAADDVAAPMPATNAVELPKA